MVVVFFVINLSDIFFFFGVHASVILNGNDRFYYVINLYDVRERKLNLF
jgi:hypothetical protein